MNQETENFQETIQRYVNERFTKNVQVMVTVNGYDHRVTFGIKVNDKFYSISSPFTEAYKWILDEKFLYNECEALLKNLSQRILGI